jgi:hypothetical protein
LPLLFNHVISGDIVLAVRTVRLDNRSLIKNFLQRLCQLFLVLGPVEFHNIAATSAKFYAFIKSIDKTSNTKQKYNNAYAISDLAIFYELVVGIPKNTPGNRSEIFEVPCLVGVCISDQA